MIPVNIRRDLITTPSRVKSRSSLLGLGEADPEFYHPAAFDRARLGLVANYLTAQPRSLR